MVESNNIQIEKLTVISKEEGWLGEPIYEYQGFCYHSMKSLEGVMNAQQHFKARADDILLTTYPKSGTTWLKALVFAIINRTIYDHSSHPLLTSNPHDCVPFLELNLFWSKPFVDPDSIPSPRILATHVAYPALPESVVSSGCKMVYILRNPKDLLISFSHFVNNMRENKGLPPIPLHVLFDSFCKGLSPFGSYWAHVLGYWKASLEWPNGVLLLKYEDMKREPLLYVKKLAVFLGQPFSPEEEENGVVEEILKLCSFEKMRNLEVNKNGKHQIGISNSAFFREAKVGDWEKHLRREMIEELDQIMKEKFKGSSLTF